MSISSISSTLSSNIENWQAMASQRKQDFQSLSNSLSSGDLSGAQQSYSALQDMFSSNASSPAVPSTSATGSSPVQQDFATIGQDLSSGNLSQAQKDFTQMQTDIQSAFNQNGGVGMHHHHGHHAPSSSQDSSSSSSSTDASLSTGLSSLLSQYTQSNAANNNSSMTSSLLNLFA